MGQETVFADSRNIDTKNEIGNQMSQISTPEWLLDSAQAADFLGIAESTIRKWVSSRYVPYIKMGRLVKFNRNSLEKWLLKIEKKGISRDVETTLKS